MKRFGVMLDMSRNAVMKPQQVKDYACILKKMGYNMIQLYTEDTYEVENEPYFGYMRGKYSVEELKDIVTYCQSIDMEVIPCIQTLAHLNQMFKWNQYKEINDYADILLVGESRTYELIENMFKTLRKCFTSEYVHIGMDEAHMLGLGKYLDKHGVTKRFDILCGHLQKVIEIAEKYGFKPIMWSDMFFRLANQGEYYPEDPTLTEEAKASIPPQIGLVYWDYYFDEQEHYEKMMKAHLKAENEIWFAGGAWTWTGFASGNYKTLHKMIPAMRAAKSCGIENIFMTMWGDNGKECSFYSVLPSLYTIRRSYDGETNITKIKAEFKEIVGEDYDAMSALDCPNYIGGNLDSSGNVCKHMLYSDPFSGFLDVTVKNGGVEEYKTYASRLHSYAKASAKYGYLFESEALLCELMSVKYDLGVRTRQAYKAGDKEAIIRIAEDYEKALQLLEKYHESFQTLWYTENKPYGFDVQDIRLGGLMQRLKSCRRRLLEYAQGTIENIPELEEELLPYDAGKITDGDTPCLNSWAGNASVNIL